MAKRWTAYKMNIKDIVGGNYTEDGFVKFGNLQANRVRVMGTVVSKLIGDSRKYGFFILDDGTETIRVRAFEDQLSLIEKVEIGYIVYIIGRLRKYDEEIYIIPEIVVKIEDPNWEILRKLELEKQRKKMLERRIKSSEPEELIVQEEIVEKEVIEGNSSDAEGPRQKVIRLIRENDKGKGTEVSLLNEEVGNKEVVLQVLTDLMNEGEIFEPRPGKVKLLE